MVLFELALKLAQCIVYYLTTVLVKSIQGCLQLHF